MAKYKFSIHIQCEVRPAIRHIRRRDSPDSRALCGADINVDLKLLVTEETLAKGWSWITCDVCPDLYHQELFSNGLKARQQRAW
jgi:hypothetical protein